MPAQWTGEIIGKMHVHNITAKQLSAFLGYNPKYVSAVLNGKRAPKNAPKKFKEALEKAVDAIGKSEQKGVSGSDGG